MENKRCFVIMPISDCLDYPHGHFTRVYEHIIIPACELAGFKPIRADDIMTTNYIALDIIKNIIECEMSICDLSSRNPNVLYELGIRQLFNLPVTLIKDFKTSRVFDIQGFRDVEYDESLRIDTVHDVIESMAEVIKNTYENKTSEINSLVSLLGIESAKLTERKKISIDTELLLNAIGLIDIRISNLEKSDSIPMRAGAPPSNLPINEDVGDFLNQSDIENLKPGDFVFHLRFGKGEVIEIRNNETKNKVASIKFSVGVKAILLRLGDGLIRKFK